MKGWSLLVLKFRFGLVDNVGLLAVISVDSIRQKSKDKVCNCSEHKSQSPGVASQDLSPTGSKREIREMALNH